MKTLLLTMTFASILLTSYATATNDSVPSANDLEKHRVVPQKSSQLTVVQNMREKIETFVKTNGKLRVEVSEKYLCDLLLQLLQLYNVESSNASFYYYVEETLLRIFNGQIPALTGGDINRLSVALGIKKSLTGAAISRVAENLKTDEECQNFILLLYSVVVK